MDRDFPLDVENNSDHSIRIYFNDDEGFKAIYPDTTITNFEDRLSVEIFSSEKKFVAGGDATWENIFEVSVPNDTLSLFILHSDTLAKYEWQQIIDDYNILKRYDLSLGDLQRLDFKVTYPPDAGMEGIQMYPPE